MLYQFWRLFDIVKAEVNAPKNDTDRVKEVLL
jgi:hypothetical protein